MKKERIPSLEAMDRFSENFKATYLHSAEKRTHATVLALFGDLGSGKTTFVRSLAHHFGISSRVTSPTFVIEKRYAVSKPNEIFRKLIHIDAYRLDGAHDEDTLLLEETLADPQNLLCIEWPENIKDLEADHELFFEFVDDHTRTVSFDECEKKPGK
ncbi:MAG TPA: tRNA (adenosine(37)-N6)-threonylcarbamoyltransferase complex ATPase subunit type 1 TsaE [Candidatus Paceibacterota bacterium]|nr:tRNA (adenosine(37)-N6)-threonylcarbamoyltransferase complex ATPase subunit type 1 TsaE [Candidatus Paceibacterota bacterium]